MKAFSNVEKNALIQVYINVVLKLAKINVLKMFVQREIAPREIYTLMSALTT